MITRICLLALGYLVWFNHALTFENPWHVFILFVAGAFLVPLIVECFIRLLTKEKHHDRTRVEVLHIEAERS
jgi:hypothetical protein